MAFDPTQPFEVVEEPQAQAGGAPRFDPTQAFEVVDDGQTGLLEGVGNSLKRGWTLSQMASEMEKPAPDPQRIAVFRQQMQAAPPSDEYMATMDDRRAPEESWTAFKSAPVKVLAELMGESLSAFAGQMIEKAPNRVAIGLGAGAAMGAPVVGIGAVPGGFIGAGAGFAEASGAASYSLEMAGGVLDAMQQAGVPLDNPEALAQALQDPQRMQLAREFAQRKAVPIAIFDGASAVIGGRMFGGGKVASAMAKLGQGMAETFTQAAMGAAGEASGQLAQTGNISSGRSVLAEGVAEIPTGLVEIGAGQLSQKGANANQSGAMAPTSVPSAETAPAPFTPPPAADTVVVEEVFGDPTTAAAEPAAAKAGFDPSQPFEVVEEPSATIVTEPAAASVAPESTQPDTTVDTSAQEWADSLPSADKYLQKNNKTDAPYSGGFQEGELLIDKYGENPYVYKAQYIDPKTFLGNLKLEGMTYEQVVAMPTTQQYIEWYKQGKESPPIDVVVKQNESEKGQLYSTNRRRVVAAIEAGVSKIPALVEVGRRDEVFASVQQQPAPMPVQEKAPKPRGSSAATLLSRRALRFEAQAGQTSGGQGTAVGSVGINERIISDSLREMQKGVESGQTVEQAASRARSFARELVANHNSQRRGDVNWQRNDDLADKQIGNAVLDIQEVERGEATVDEQGFTVAASPDTPAKRSRRRIKNMTAQSGAIDLSIVEDLVEYGKTIYRAGMSYAQWSAAMIKEFGQAVAEFLQQAFNRIVQAYKDSPYSDTTGAVGDVRPKQKPRQFEEKAAKAPGISEEARAQMGNDPYVPITLRGVAEQAKAWIAENGIEAAERRILGLADEGQTPTPLDFAIGLELTANLSATGNASRAASVVRTMSRRATSLGQTISTLAMLSRLTPEGIVFYANQIIEQHIGSLPPERQAEIRAAQDDVANLEETVATTRKRTAEDSIINGTQGGEKIQEKLKRRIPDKTQKQRTNVSIRSVLTSQATKAEATKQIAQILTDNGISQSEAAALATAITSRFYKVLEDARKVLANSRKPAKGKGRVTIDKLLAQLKDGKITDEEFVSALAQVRGVPALTAADKARIQSLAEQYKASTDDQISLVLAARLFEEVHSIIPPDFWVKLRALSYLSMLFAPKTWIRNLGGNQIQWIANAGRDAVINMVVDPTMSLLTGRRTSAFVNTKRFRSLFTPVGDVIRGYKWNQQQNPSASFMENAKAGIEHLRILSKLTTQNKFEISDVKDVGRRIFSSKFMSAWDTALSVALGGGDRGFWMSAFTASLAQREAASKKNGEWTGQPTPEDIEAAYADAMHAIYQNPNVISQSANRIRAALNRISTFGKTDQFGLGTALLAFTQVPGAITMRGLIEWSPLGMLNALYESMRPLLFKATNGKSGGTFRQEQFNKAFTQSLLGTGGLYAAGYWLYAMGIVTASREDDDDLEALRRASGMGAYRVNISALKRLLMSYTKQEPEDGDLIVPYDWAQPLAITFSAGAEFAKEVEQNNLEGLKKGLAAKASMAAISLAAGAKSLEEQPLLSGLSSFMKTWGYSGPMDAMVNTVSGLPSMFVPQLVRQANQLMDNTVRETRGDQGVIRAFNQIAANTPGVADKFPPRFDIMGQAIERYQYAGNSVFNVLINPAMTTRIKDVPALREVARLVDTTGENKQVPRQVRRTATINGQQVDFTNEQISAYQYYLGNYTMSIFNWRMASPAYARLPDTQKVNLLAQDLEDIDAATKSALFGHDVNRLTRRQRVMRNNLVNSPLGQSMPPR